MAKIAFSTSAQAAIRTFESSERQLTVEESVPAKIGIMYDAKRYEAEFRLTSQRSYMKRLIFVLVVTTAVFATVAIAQNPAAGGPGGGAPRGGRGTPAPPATGPIADLVTKFTDAVNKQDEAALQKMVTADAVLIDEDGHFDPIGMWITKLTATGSKTLTVLGGRGLSPLKVYEMGDTAWAAFNYNLKETVTPRGQSTSSPNEMAGTVTMVFKKNGTDWQAILVHIAVTGKAITPH